MQLRAQLTDIEAKPTASNESPTPRPMLLETSPDPAATPECPLILVPGSFGVLTAPRGQGRDHDETKEALS